MPSAHTASKGSATAPTTTGADKRERILRGAIKVFARKGFYATRVSEIAKAATRTVLMASMLSKRIARCDERTGERSLAFPRELEPLRCPALHIADGGAQAAIR